ncbi:MAG: ATP-binding cassette domain-containing protein [Anaerolineales bacterium]|nr:ATP-binding cassette domain-containing protein [Anaerolineales bacterium]
MSNDIILDFQAVTKEFPGVKALENVSIQIRRGEIHGLCGENGAGKSTLMKILSGVHPWGSYEGKILYEGEELHLEDRAIRRASEQGIAIVYQELTLVPDMTVGENVYLGREPVNGVGINWNEMYSETRKILETYKLDIEPQSIVRNLGMGKKQMTEIAKALSENAKILILDEPTSALTESEIDKLMLILETLKEHGVTCIYITHKLEEFFRITDTISVLRDGKLITTQPTSELNEDKLIQHMVGREMKERFPKGDRKPGEVILSVENLHAVDPDQANREILNGISFDLRQGEILGVAGLMGSGRTELVTTLFGEYGVITEGKVVLDGKELHVSSSRQAMNEGLSLVPEDRKSQGLVLIQSLLKNISLPNLPHFSNWFQIDHLAEMNTSREYAQRLAIKAPNLTVPCFSLSGGNQQKVVIAKWLMSKPKVLIMDDPTRGIDVGAKFEIYSLMNELAESGIAIIMISSELEEILGMSDRIVVLHEGKSTQTLDAASADQETIMGLATGVANNHRSK